MVWKPHVTVAAVVERNGHFLLVEETADGRAVLNQPAGHLEPGESLLDAAVRETREETRWGLEPHFVVGIYRWTNPYGRTFLRTCFAGTVSDHDPALPLDSDIRAVHWLTREQLLIRRGQHRSPQVMRCVDDYLAGRRFPLEVIVDID